MSRPESVDEWSQAYRQFQKKLFEAGYAAMHYPQEMPELST